MLDLHPAARELSRVLDSVTDDHLEGPTPCPGYSVGALLDHVCGLTLAFTWAAEKSTAEHAVGGGQAPSVSTAHLDPRWREVLPGRLSHSPPPGTTRQRGKASPRRAGSRCPVR
jgi:uncharacterized protein (TIGR03083 family)